MSLSHKRVAFAIVATALLAIAIAAAPRTLPAQDIEKNETGVLAYPNNIRTGIMYQAKEGGRFPSATFFIGNNIVEVSTFGGDTHVELKKYVPGA